MASTEIVEYNALYAQKNGIVETSWSDESIVNAIYWAEGGKNAKKPYGVQSDKCTSKTKCKAMAKRIVQKNRRKYIQTLKQRDNIAFIDYLGSHYCPTEGAISEAEKSVNRNWARNVRWFLEHKKKS